MNKPSRFFWFLVLAQACAVVLVLGWLSIRKSPLRYAPVKYVQADLRGVLKTVLDMFAADCGRYPTTAEGLQALITCPTNISQKLWKGPYFDTPQIPLDPWDHYFVYRYPGIHNTNSYDLYSTGPDGISKSGGNDPDDINNWDINSPHGGDFSAHDPFPEIMCLLLIIPLACGFCSIATIFSPSARKFLSRNRAAHFVWLMTSLIVLMMFLATLTTRIAAR